jgi:hypothetical protein
MATVLHSRFFPLIALALGAVIVLGFARTYYLRAFFEVPPINLLAHLHGIVFSAWLALFVVQTQLIARNRIDLHMRFGIAGAALAVLVVSVGLVTAIAGAPSPRPRPMGFTGLQFMIFPLFGILFFGVCVAAAIVLRKRAALHKRLMVLGMIAVLGPPVARLIRFFGIGDHFIAIQMGVAAAFVAWALIHDWTTHRMIHPVIALGGLLVVLSWPLRVAIARTDSWVTIARALTG